MSACVLDKPAAAHGVVTPCHTCVHAHLVHTPIQIHMQMQAIHTLCYITSSVLTSVFDGEGPPLSLFPSSSPEVEPLLINLIHLINFMAACI